jgi:exopolysaccharide biosynthesis polyprenyl glycosylphosphotransferase
MAEFVVLGFLELSSCFLLALAVLAEGGVFSSAAMVDSAAAMSIGLVGTALIIGTYRGQSFVRHGGLMTRAILAVLAAFLCGLFSTLIRDRQTSIVDPAVLDTLFHATLVCLGLIIFVRGVFAYALRCGVFVRRIVLAGEAGANDRLRAAIELRNCGTFEVVASFDFTQPDSHDLLAQAKRRDIWAVVLTQPAESVGLIAADLPHAMRAAAFWERYLQRIDLDNLDHNILPDSRLQGFSARLHRIADLGLSLSLLFFTLPLMIFTALAIRFDSPGPVLYRQERVGFGGKSFVLTKFRSMRPDAEASGPVWAMAQDKRVTRIGQFIRLTRIDELPQLFNILRGEMSFIGPRPERPVFVAQLAEQVPFYSDRHGVKPGLTGWAQVNYPYGASVEDARKKLSYDLYYVRHQNILLDAQIFFSTVRVILFQEGAR